MRVSDVKIQLVGGYMCIRGDLRRAADGGTDGDGWERLPRREAEGGVAGGIDGGVLGAKWLNKREMGWRGTAGGTYEIASTVLAYTHVVQLADVGVVLAAKALPAEATVRGLDGGDFGISGSSDQGGIDCGEEPRGPASKGWWDGWWVGT